MDETRDGFKGWAIVELMGHRRLAGLVTEQPMFGTSLLRLDVYEGDAPSPSATQFYGGGAVYCLTPTTEAIARAMGAQLRPEPVAVWELPAPARGDEPDEAEALDETDHGGPW
jgi:hypothetical protein